jgi:hypothetical protein
MYIGSQMNSYYANYFKCAKDNSSARDFSYNFFSSARMTIGTCAENCKNYKAFGLQIGYITI